MWRACRRRARLVGYGVTTNAGVARRALVPGHQRQRPHLLSRSAATATTASASILENEGVDFVGGRVNLDHYGWPPREKMLDELVWGPA